MRWADVSPASMSPASMRWADVYVLRPGPAGPMADFPMADFRKRSSGRRLRLRPGPAGPMADFPMADFRKRSSTSDGSASPTGVTFRVSGAALDAGPAAVRVFLWSEAVDRKSVVVGESVYAGVSRGALSHGARCDGRTAGQLRKRSLNDDGSVDTPGRMIEADGT